MQWFLSFLALTAHAMLSWASSFPINEYVNMEPLPMNNGLDVPTDSNARSSTLDLGDHSPDVNFRGTTFLGLIKACQMQPGAEVVEIRAGWHNATVYYPDIRMWFSNVSAPEEPFSLVTPFGSYGTWFRPKNPLKLRRIYPKFDFYDFRMDLVEAWQLARGAGWDKPLSHLAVTSGQVKPGTQEVLYIFPESTTQVAVVGGSSKDVSIINNPAKRSRIARQDTISNLTVHSPDVNFLSNTTAGMNKVLSFLPGALPKFVRLVWEASNQFPSIDMFFIVGDEPFSLTMESAQYGIWDNPSPYGPGYLPGTPFDWSGLTMDLPEAWARVQYAGWDGPLGALDVLFAKETEQIVPEIWYKFHDRKTSLAACVGVSSKNVILTFTAAAEYGNETVEYILPGLVNGTSFTSELGLVNGVSAGVKEVASP